MSKTLGISFPLFVVFAALMFIGALVNAPAVEQWVLNPLVHDVVLRDDIQFLVGIFGLTGGGICGCFLICQLLRPLPRRQSH